MLRLVTVAALAAITVSSAAAQNLDAIKARKDTLKAMGKATEAPGAMMKGEAPFDLAKVKAALAAYQDGAAKLPELFPDNSKTGGETEALPVIWDKKQDFTDRYKKLAADAKAATATITDEFSFQEEFPKVVGNCSACHKVYRKPKE
jgi:cytochrome c556